MTVNFRECEKATRISLFGFAVAIVSVKRRPQFVFAIPIDSSSTGPRRPSLTPQCARSQS
ncbi:hypothetical protein E2562_004005 [Oryza meyeriana var. granulata]|uniref:Uncharacterized protein n=1 Tax=Oryza meyeriana var. granulata TaxID=110450 RepID=A0A6G1BI91_9ORYZ|nr:hypothetical protein E2562_004005 [Oryza meyeriana var. granulata]